MAEFILETNYSQGGLSVRRIIRLRINPKTNNLCRYLYRYILKLQKPVPLMRQLRQKTVYVQSGYEFRDGSETDHPSKTNFPPVSASSRRANTRISLRRRLLHNSS